MKEAEKKPEAKKDGKEAVSKTVQAEYSKLFVKVQQWRTMTATAGWQRIYKAIRVAQRRAIAELRTVAKADLDKMQAEANVPDGLFKEIQDDCAALAKYVKDSPILTWNSVTHDAKWDTQTGLVTITEIKPKPRSEKDKAALKAASKDSKKKDEGSTDPKGK